MTGIVVADTGPLIALGRAGCLKLLHDLYKDVLIPPAVRDELHLGSGRPGARQSAEAFEQGWLQVQEPSADSAQALSDLMLVLDPGEAEAILLAEEVHCRFLLIDERKGRAIAKRRGVPVVGIAGVLVGGKKTRSYRCGCADFEESGTGWISNVYRFNQRNRSACGGG